MKYFLVILYLYNPCGDAAKIAVRGYDSIFECQKQQRAELKVRDSKYPFKQVYCSEGRS